MVVEDDPIVARDLAATFAKLGHEDIDGGATFYVGGSRADG
jgi:hypothetical protein